MRKSIFRIGAASAATIFLFSACSENKTPSPLDFESVEISEEVALASGRDDLYSLDVRIEYPTAGEPSESLSKIKTVILDATLGTDYSSYAVDKAVEKYKEDRIESYKEENLELLDDLLQVDEGVMEADLSWDEKIEGKFQGEYKGIRSYVVDTYIYQGGAHGSYGQLSVNIKMSTGEVIEEEDFFISDYSVRLSGIISSHLREALPDDESYAMLFMTDVQPNGNFQFTSSGIKYIYSPYEIGPYALGIITVSIPWEEISDLINETVLE